jgi:hypothetical protein
MTQQTQARTDPEYRRENIAGEYDMGTKGEVNGAAVAGGVAGLLLGGPFVGAIAAASAAYIAATKDGDIGNLARDAGSSMNKLGKKILKLEKENKILDRTTEELVKGASWVEARMSSKKADPKLDTEANLSV